MMMVEHEEGVILKGKRTKRQRPLAITSSSEESGGRVLASATSDSTQEDEDMAKCLILLAQGQGQGQTRKREVSSLGAGPGTTGYSYECKTCQRSFSSFQALGGHRASHKKPKNEEKIAAAAALSFGGNNCDFQFHRSQIPQQFNMSTTTTLSMQIGKSSKVHECSICSAEFSSGQALGGHMRRHRTFANPPTVSMAAAEGFKKPRNLLQLDLNLPAPEEESKFSFGSKEKLLVFSASSLVNCHY